jgi:CRISPR-associated endonuclease/helicase Cas3
LTGDDLQWRQSVEVLPPTAEESIELPLAAVRQWLSGQQTIDAFTDLEGEPAPEQSAEPGDLARSVVRCGPHGEIEVVGWDQIRAADRVIVPAAYGGCDRYGWNPARRHPAADIGDLCGGTGSRPVSIRLGPTLTAAVAAHDPQLAAALGGLVDQAEQDRQNEQLHPEAYCGQIRQMLLARPDIVELLGEGLDRDGDQIPPHLAVLRRLAQARKPAAEEHLALNCVVLTSDITSYSDDNQPQGSAVARGQLPLDDHQLAVQKRAEEFAANLRLPAELVRAVSLAARWHDEGKRDDRFQVMLHGGDHYAATAAAAQTPPRILAKSGMNPLDRALLRQAQQHSGYPAGMRHEALSAQIADVLLQNAPGIDRELVLHLIASHHGHARPLLPAVTDPAPRTSIQRNGEKIAVDTGQSINWLSPERFAALTSRYGRWGLARLEAVVRLADIWCSAREEAVHDNR